MQLEVVKVRFQGAEGCSQWFLQSRCSLDSLTGVGLQLSHKNAPTTPQSAMACGLQVPKNCPRATMVQVLAYHHQQTFPGLPRAVCPQQNSFCSLWGGASTPAVKNVLGDVAPVVQKGGDPGCHEGGSHTWILPDQCGPRSQTWPFGGGLNTEKMA